MNIPQRKLWLLSIIAVAIVMLLTFVTAPNVNNSRGNSGSGSTFAKNPYGYGAWYEYMSTTDTPVKRWQKPLSEFIARNIQGETYIQIRSKVQFQDSKEDSHRLNQSERKWIEQGNTLVIIGEFEPATNAPFSSFVPQGERQIKIETTRRKQTSARNTILQDQFGAVVWQNKLGNGKVIYVTTPYLAANAYQEFIANYQFLAELVSDNQSIWVDEYIHGHKDRETIAQEQRGGLWGYLAQTPLYLFLVQSLIAIIVAAIAGMRRFGKPIIPQTTLIANSTAYISALAGVLEKAECTDFVVDEIGKDERLKLQKSLGLGQTLVDEQTLVTAWAQQTGKPATKLRQLLALSQRQQQLTEVQLIAWSKQWQEILNLEH